MRLLITGAWAEAKQNIPLLKSSGHDVVFMQQEKDELPCDPLWVEGVVCNGLFLFHDIRLFKNLEYIQLTSAGLDRVPLDHIKQKGITLNNARGVYSVPMAEFAVCFVLQIYKQAEFFRNNQRAHSWKKHRWLCELCGKNVLILGCGSVGAECAKRFSAFGCKIIGVDVVSFENRYFDNIYEIDRLKDVIPEADVMILTLPLTDRTEGLVNTEFLNSLKQGCAIVNISRGKIIDENALADSLKNKDIYAALDVFDEEPLSPDSPLWDMENVIITPHNSFVGEGNGKRLTECIIENLEAFGGAAYQNTDNFTQK